MSRIFDRGEVLRDQSFSISSTKSTVGVRLTIKELLFPPKGETFRVLLVGLPEPDRVVRSKGEGIRDLLKARGSARCSVSAVIKDSPLKQE